MQASIKETLCDCGHIAKSNGCSTGYGADAEGKKHCFACCGERDKADMLATGRATLYLSGDDLKKGICGKVTNWPGTLEIRPYYARQGRHNIAGVRIDVWFMFEGQKWHGTQYGRHTQILHCKRVKNDK